MAVMDRDYFNSSVQKIPDHVWDEFFSDKTVDTIREVYGNNPFGTALLEYHGKEKEMATTTKRECVVFTGDQEMPLKVKEAIKPRLEELSDYVESDIVWVTCHSNRSCVPKNVDERMHIFSMMTPAWVEFESKKIDFYKINGKEIALPPGQMDYLDPTMEEIPGCDGIYDEDGMLMALMVGYNIYILNDCLHACNNQYLDCAIMVFEHIVNEAVRLWNECEGGEYED